MKVAAGHGGRFRPESEVEAAAAELAVGTDVERRALQRPTVNDDDAWLRTSGAYIPGTSTSTPRAGGKRPSNLEGSEGGVRTRVAR